MSAENTLTVRLVECAKTAAQWAALLTIPKRGEICLEMENQGTNENPDLLYKMKIGDGIHTYANLNYFPVDANIAQVVASWVEQNLDVNEYAQASYDDATKKLSVYGIKEVDGKIVKGTNHVDIQLAEGTKIDITSVAGVITIAHEGTARTDTTKSSAGYGTSVVTGVTTDSTGHVTGVETGPLPTKPATKNVIGTSDAATTDGASANPYLNHIEDGDVKSHHQLIGGTQVDVNSDASGNVTIKHETITRTDAEESAQPANLVTEITTANGHVTGTKTINPDDLTVGIAKDLDAPVVRSDNSMWNHRVTGGTINIGEETVNISKLRGNTLVWNQLLGEGTFVDMGLPSGNLWATSNIDVTQPNKFAASPFQYEGSFFSWGNIEGHNPISTSAFDYNWGSVNAAEPWYDGQPYGNTKGNTLSGNIPVGEEYDAARANLGSPWRMPTMAEFNELFAGCIYIDATGTEIPAETTNKLVTVNGIVGLYLQSKTNGNRLFFACSGYGSGTSWYGRGSYGYYWSASIGSARNARGLGFYSGGVNPQSSDNRCNGFAVRAIAKTSDTIITDPNGHKYYIKNKQNVFDLTKMFGAGNEPSTVEEFEAMFPNPYYPYNEGELLSLKPTGVKSVGFNQWDEETIEGSLIYLDGSIIPATNRLCTKNYVKVLPSTQYYFSTSIYRVACYDSAKNHIQSEWFAPSESEGLHTTGPNTHYVRFDLGISYGGTYNNDICINISDPNRNGTYEPYKESTLDLNWIKSIKDNNDNQLFPYGLLSAGSVHDEVGDNYAVKKVGSVDLGSLNWTYNGVTAGIPRFRATISQKAFGYDNIICEKYPYNPSPVALMGVDNCVCGHSSTHHIFVSDSTYTDAATFNDAMNGVMLYYELAEPITVYFDKKPMTYPVDDLGTETLLPEGVDSTTGVPLSAPFNGTFEYKSNFKDAVIDLIDTVNAYKNPVRGVDNSDQTVGQLAEYDSDSTVKASGYKASNATISPTGSENASILPTVAALIAYVQGVAQNALHYQGTVVRVADLPSTGTAAGDVYILSQDDGNYDAGDWFIRNKANNGWDVVQGSVRVTNNDITLTPDGTKKTIANVEGTPITVTMPDMNFSEPAASGDTLTVVDTISQSNGKISATKKTIQDASKLQKGVVQFVTDVHNSTDQNKAVTAGDAWTEFAKRNVKAVDVSQSVPINLYPSVLVSSSAPSASTVPSNWNTSIYGTWTGAPQFVGQLFVSTSGSASIATGTSDVTDWIPITNN